MAAGDDKIAIQPSRLALSTPLLDDYDDDDHNNGDDHDSGLMLRALVTYSREVEPRRTPVCINPLDDNVCVGSLPVPMDQVVRPHIRLISSDRYRKILHIREFAFLQLVRSWAPKPGFDQSANRLPYLGARLVDRSKIANSILCNLIIYLTH